MQLFSIRDIKADFFGNPFTCRSIGEALRAFHQAYQDTNTQISKYPDDFVLYQLGEFDVSSGVVKSLDAPVNLGAAAQFVTNKE